MTQDALEHNDIAQHYGEVIAVKNWTCIYKKKDVLKMQLRSPLFFKIFVIWTILIVELVSKSMASRDKFYSKTLKIVLKSVH